MNLVTDELLDELDAALGDARGRPRRETCASSSSPAPATGRSRPARTSRASSRTPVPPGRPHFTREEAVTAAAREPAHADDRGDRRERAGRRARDRARVRHPRRVGDARSSGCLRSDWASRPGAGGTQRLPRAVGVGARQGADADRPDHRRARGASGSASSARSCRAVRRAPPPTRSRAEIAERGPLAVREVKRLIDRSVRARHRRRESRQRSTRRNESSTARTCSRERVPFSRSDEPDTGAGEEGQ